MLLTRTAGGRPRFQNIYTQYILKTDFNCVIAIEQQACFTPRFSNDDIAFELFSTSSARSWRVYIMVSLRLKLIRFVVCQIHKSHCTTVWSNLRAVSHIHVWPVFRRKFRDNNLHLGQEDVNTSVYSRNFLRVSCDVFMCRIFNLLSICVWFIMIHESYFCPMFCIAGERIYLTKWQDVEKWVLRSVGHRVQDDALLSLRTAEM